MTLVPVILVIGASGAWLTAITMWMTRAAWLPTIARLAPQRRTRWLLGALGAPLAGGALAVLLSFGPCIATILEALPDRCRLHAGPSFMLCLWMAERPNVAVLVAASVSLVPIFARAIRLARGAMRTRAALATLRTLGRYDEALGAWVVPGPLAAVAGWPTGIVYLGEALVDAFAAETVAIVMAHERAHLAHGDLARKTIARLLGALHVRPLATSLLDALDLALEQACDAAAADEVHDPVRVAQTLVDLARMPHVHPEEALALSAHEHLEARVSALCAPSWGSAAGLAKCLFVVGAVVVCGVLFDDHVHEAFETFLGSFWS